MSKDNSDKPFVLIVEDDEDISKGIKLVLDAAGYETATAENGEVAKLQLLERKPDVMTLDINMPELTGLELLDQVYESDLVAGVKIILISGQPEDELVQGVVSGVDWVMQKPVNFISVAEIVEKLLSS